MKIVYCLPAIYASGGIERVVINKANYLVNSGYDVAIITTDQEGRPPFFRVDSKVEQYDLGINYHRNGNRRFLSKIYNYIYNRNRHKKELSHLLKKLNADIVISVYMNEMSLVPYIRDGSKKILEFHFSRSIFNLEKRLGIRGLVDKFLRKLDLIHIRRYDRFVVLTEEDKGFWPKLKNLSVIYNASSFSGVPRSNCLEAVAVGRYVPQKGFNNLIEIWAKVGGKYKLHIYGDGVLREELTNLVLELGLEERVVLEMPTRDIKAVYENSAALIMTSMYEGLPMTMIEAQSCGLPVITYDFSCGPKDVITSGVNGFIVPWGNQDLMADRITEVLSNQELQMEMSQNALKNSQRFQQKVIMQQWCELFECLRKYE